MNDYLLLIDGSSLLSTQFFGNMPREILFAKTLEEKQQFFPKIMQTSEGYYTNAVYGFVRTLLKILQEQRPTHMAVAWDVSRNTFRRELYPDYKGTRSETLYPLSEQFALCQFVLEQLGIVQFMDQRYEADDFCGTIAQMYEKELPICIMTKDNDYLQLITEQTSLWLMHSSVEKTDELYKKYGIDKKKTNAPDRCFVYTPELVVKEFGVLPENVNSLKGIQGDTSDNIKGVPGVGEATAKALISHYRTVDALYQDIHGRDKKGLDELKNFWKEALGIKRSPLNFLTKTSEDELVGEESARLSELLATIKKDIPMDGLSLEHLRLHIDQEQAQRVCAALEFKSVDFVLPENQKQSVVMKYPRYSYEAGMAGDLFSEHSRQEFVRLTAKMEKVHFSETVSAEPSYSMHEISELEEVESLFARLIKEEAEYIGFFYDKNNDQPGLWLSESQDKNWFLPVQFFVTEEFLGNRLQQLLDKCENTIFATIDWKEQLSFVRSSIYPNVIDIKIAAYLLNPVVGEYTADKIAERLAEEDPKRFQLTGRPTSLIAKETAAYFMDELEKQGMKKLFEEVEMPLVVALYDMEQRGIRVERHLLKEYAVELDVRMKSLEREIYQLAGEEFNINSPKQLGVILFEKLHLPHGKKTKTGYSTSADVLERLRPEDPIIGLILDYRQVAKLKSTYADGLEAFIQDDNRIHGKFHQTITATGRISSTEPNLQNIPVRMELGRRIRKAFVPEPGYIFLDADYSQIELRVLAHMSGDDRLIEAYRTAQDIHRITASQVFHTPFDEVTPQQRSNAKAVNFGIVYGISSFGLGQDLNISRKEAEEYITQYFATYPGVKLYMDKLVGQGKSDGYVSTLFGRRRPIPEFESANFMTRQFGERVAMNSPIQGTAADIIKIAMIRVNERLKKEVPESGLLLQIHDELLVETRLDQIELVQAIMEEEMQQAVVLMVPLDVEVKQGSSWLEAK